MEGSRQSAAVRAPVWVEQGKKNRCTEYRNRGNCSIHGFPHAFIVNAGSGPIFSEFRIASAPP